MPPDLAQRHPSPQQPPDLIRVRILTPNWPTNALWKPGRVNAPGDSEESL
jgi:hypothetical protein